MNQGARKFLEQTPPFSFLPAPELATVAQKLTPVEYPAGAIPGVQGEQRLRDLWIIRRGAVELYSEEKGEKKLSGLAGPGEIAGGISLLVNDGYPLRTMRVRETSEFYRLPSADFLELCRRPCPKGVTLWHSQGGQR